MNALGALDFANSISASLLPGIAAKSTESLGFVNQFHALFLSAPGATPQPIPDSSPDSILDLKPVETGTISANAYRDTSPAAAPVAARATTKQIANALIRSMFPQTGVHQTVLHPIPMNEPVELADARQTPVRPVRLLTHEIDDAALPPVTRLKTAPLLPVPVAPLPAQLSAPSTKLEAPSDRAAPVFAPPPAAKAGPAMPAPTPSPVPAPLPASLPAPDAPVPAPATEAPALIVLPQAGSATSQVSQAAPVMQIAAQIAAQPAAQLAAPIATQGSLFPLAFEAILTEKNLSSIKGVSPTKEPAAGKDRAPIAAPPALPFKASEQTSQDSSQPGQPDPKPAIPLPQRSIAAVPPAAPKEPGETLQSSQNAQPEAPSESEPQPPTSSPVAGPPDEKTKPSAVANEGPADNPGSASTAPASGVGMHVAPVRTSEMSNSAETDTKSADPISEPSSDSLTDSMDRPVPPSPPQAALANAIFVRIANPGAPAVDLHVVDRAGELHVAVRTPDVDLQTSLREDLGTLVTNLDRSGFRAEVFTPREAGLAAASASGSQMNFESGKDAPRSGSGDPGQPSMGGRQPRGQQEHNSQQNPQHRGKQIKEWIEELENS